MFITITESALEVSIEYPVGGGENMHWVGSNVKVVQHLASGRIKVVENNTERVLADLPAERTIVFTEK